MLALFVPGLLLFWGSRYLPQAKSDKAEVEIVPVTAPPTKITEIRVYPIKGMQGIKLSQAKITPTGFELDRQWLLVK